MRHVPSDVVEAIRAGRLIDAIKRWREFTGDSLLEAKNFIEAYREELQQQNGEKPSSPPTSKELPRQELLTKLLKMTTSSNDGEALTAMRKANALLSSAGWDWDRLIAGKIVVVGDPFTSLSTPTVQKPSNGQSYSAPRAPLRPRAPPPPPPAAAQRPSAPSVQYSRKSNLYPGGCYCCGITVDIGDGFVFNPVVWNARAKDKWVPICKSCNKGKDVPSSPAKRVFPPIHASINPDLHNL